MLCWVRDWGRLAGCNGTNFSQIREGQFPIHKGGRGWVGGEGGWETCGYDPSKHNDSLHLYKTACSCQMSTIK